MKRINTIPILSSYYNVDVDLLYSNFYRDVLKNFSKLEGYFLNLKFDIRDEVYEFQRE